jgi:hypothetical protein
MRTQHHILATAVVCLVALVVSAAPAAAAAAASQTTAVSPRDASLIAPAPLCTVVPEKELFITDLSVVEDCIRTTWTGPCLTPIPTPLPSTRGAWTFGKLIEGVAGTTDTTKLDAFVRNWVAEWDTAQTINADNVPARISAHDLIIDPWENAGLLKGGLLDMKKAPFRLLAIVNRMDLRDAPAGYGQPGNAGEARFVFGVLNLDSPQAVPQFTVIFEYGLVAENCEDVSAWADAFHALGSHGSFSFDYKADLQAITDQFTAIGAAPGKPNGSAINQIRSNEFIQSPWELREFRLQGRTLVGTPVPLVQVTVARTPANSHQKQQIVADFINNEEPAILAGTHDVPLVYQSTNFRGGASRHSLNFGWDGPGAACASINSPAARFLFSFNTCNGCHGDDTGTFFLHVEPRAAGVESNLSNFLTGTGTVVDICGIANTFDDIERRRVDFCQLLDKDCGQIEAEEAPHFVH